MSRKKNKKHITISGRAKIEAGIELQRSAKRIASSLPIDLSTLYREIKKNSHVVKKRGIHCVHRMKCIKIRNSFECVRCDNYEEDKCETLNHFPFVCNNCKTKGNCTKTKRYYRAEIAEQSYRKRLTESRDGIRIPEEEFNAIDAIITPLVQNKQSLNHILETHDEIRISERTLRTWINYGYTHAKAIDLPRAVRFKVKKEYNYRNHKPASVLAGRTFMEYRAYTKEHPNLLVTQFDTVLGLKSDKKRILTIHFPSIHFQFGIVLQDGMAETLNNSLLALRKKIGSDEWKRLFPVMLTDNGVEFNNLHELEVDENGEILSKVFFTDPYRSGEKGACERNHELLRYIQPKKKSIDYIDQKIINKYFSHINCYYRNSLNGIRPYDLAKTILGEDFLNTIGIEEIKPDDVTFVKSRILNK